MLRSKSGRIFLPPLRIAMILFLCLGSLGFIESMEVIHSRKKGAGNSLKSICCDSGEGISSYESDSYIFDDLILINTSCVINSFATGTSPPISMKPNGSLYGSISSSMGHSDCNISYNSLFIANS